MGEAAAEVLSPEVLDEAGKRAKWLLVLMMFQSMSSLVRIHAFSMMPDTHIDTVRTYSVVHAQTIVLMMFQGITSVLRIHFSP